MDICSCFVAFFLAYQRQKFKFLLKRKENTTFPTIQNKNRRVCSPKRFCIWNIWQNLNKALKLYIRARGRHYASGEVMNVICQEFQTQWFFVCNCWKADPTIMLFNTFWEFPDYGSITVWKRQKKKIVSQNLVCEDYHLKWSFLTLCDAGLWWKESFVAVHTLLFLVAFSCRAIAVSYFGTKDTLLPLLHNVLK